MIGEVIGHIKENNKNKYLVCNSTDENKEILKKYGQLWDGTKNKIETINNGKQSECSKDFMKIKFDTYNDLLLNKSLKMSVLTVIVRSGFEEDDKFYPQVFLDDPLNEV